MGLVQRFVLHIYAFRQEDTGRSGEGGTACILHRPYYFPLSCDFTTLHGLRL